MSEYVLLRDHIAIQKGKPPLIAGYFGADAVPYLNPEYLRGNSGAEPAKPGSDAVRAQEGETLLLWDGSNAGEFFRAKHGLVASTMAKITPDSTFQPGFFFHAVKHAEAYLKSQTSGTGIPHVDRELLEGIRAFRPMQNEQIVITQILDNLDTAIRATEALIGKLKAVKHGLLHDLLTRGIDANGQLRPLQSEAPQLYKESPLGWIPREWTGGRLADICDPNRPITYGVLKPGDYKENGIPLLQIQDVIHGSIYFGSVHRIPAPLDLAYSRTRIYGGEIVISLVGTIGKVAQIPYECERSNLHRNLGLIAIRKSDIPEFFLWFLKSERFTGQVLNETYGSTQALLNLNSVRGLTVPLPPAVERQQIADLMNGSELRIKQEISKLKKLERTKIGLMDDLLTGRVRVTPLLESVQQATAAMGA